MDSMNGFSTSPSREMLPILPMIVVTVLLATPVLLVCVDVRTMVTGVDHSGVAAGP